MGIALQILEIARASLPADARATRVRLRVGKLTAVVPASLRFCFGAAAQGTPFEGAELDITEIPVVARCQACGVQMPLPAPPFRCSGCGGGRLDFLSGRELLVESIEVADDPPSAAAAE